MERVIIFALVGLAAQLVDGSLGMAYGVTSSTLLLAAGVAPAAASAAVHFSEITAAVTGLSDRMLAVRLKELQRSGLVERVVEPTTPVSVHYRLTPRGRELLEALQPIVRFGLRWDPPAAPD